MCIKKVGKRQGWLTGDAAPQKRSLEASINFLATGVDAGILARQSQALPAGVKN